MKIHIILLSCLCGTMAITVHHETTGSLTKNTKEYKTTLKDIRLVPINQAPQSLQKPIRVRNKEPESFVNLEKPTEQPKLNSQNLQIKPRGEKKKFGLSRINQVARVGNVHQQTLQPDQSHINYMQKMANQLYLAQKHASVLSDYQKFILNQDPNVKNFVLGQSAQERSPKPFSRQVQRGRSISLQLPKVAATEQVATGSTDLKKIVVVTPRVQTSTEKTIRPQPDHSAQGTHIKYVTLAPQSVAHLVETPEPTKKVTLLSYHTPQPYTYYNLPDTPKPQAATVELPTVLSLGHGSYESPQYLHNEDENEDVHHHAEPKYEFMYKIKDQEKDNHFGHMESRKDKTTYGYYYVQLPDGRLETVKYWADKTGYHAKVDYQGEAKHPPTDHKLHSHNLIHH